LDSVVHGGVVFPYFFGPFPGFDRPPSRIAIKPFLVPT
jgi:hypothetical protein